MAHTSITDYTCKVIETLKMKTDVGVALCQKTVKLARCRNVGMLTGQGRWPKTTYTPPIPTSF